MKTITVLDIEFDVDFNTYIVNNDNGVGFTAREVTIESVCLKGDTGYDLSEVLSDYVMQRIEDDIRHDLSGVRQ